MDFLVVKWLQVVADKTNSISRLIHTSMLFQPDFIYILLDIPSNQYNIKVEKTYFIVRT
jgi:hypothetical protein